MGWPTILFLSCLVAILESEVIELYLHVYTCIVHVYMLVSPKREPCLVIQWSSKCMSEQVHVWHNESSHTYLYPLAPPHWGQSPQDLHTTDHHVPRNFSFSLWHTLITLVCLHVFMHGHIVELLHHCPDIRTWASFVFISFCLAMPAEPVECHVRIDLWPPAPNRLFSPIPFACLLSMTEILNVKAFI